MKTFILCFICIFYSSSFFAQTQEVLPPEYIKTIEFKGNNDLPGIPVVKLGQSVSLEFDDLIGDEADYYYKIRHYNFDWTPSDLSQNEYMSGFDDIRIKNYKNSFNTLQIYTHYRVNIPNSDTRALKVSGNYMLEIYNNQDEIVFSKRFILYEDIASVGTEIKRARDLKFINSQQVVNFTVSTADRIQLKNPDDNVKVLVMKNSNLQNSIYNLKPQYRMADQLVYKYDRESAFEGGNEFLNFDSKDVHGINVNIQTIELDKIYNVYLYTDGVRAEKDYSYNPDINGSFKVNSLQGKDVRVESEYTWVYFYLKANPNLEKGQEIHIYGQFNGYQQDESTLMAYNPESGLYEGRRLFKQGFYNYKYILLNPDNTMDESFISGSFYQTENQYTVLVYYREPGGRYDRLIGIGSANSENIKN